MAVDKLVDSSQLDSDLTSVANAIRAKSGGSSPLAFPAGFVSEIGNIPSGGGGGYTLEDIFDYEKPDGAVTLTNSYFGPKANDAGEPLYFKNREKITRVYLPNYNNTANVSNFFYGMNALQYVVMPSATKMHNQYCANDFNLLGFDWLGGSMNQMDFLNCTLLVAVVIRASSVCTLGNINVFQSSPFASGKAGGTLYVPNNLISSYQSASNWSTILGYANNQIKSIESTHTDPNAPVDLTTHYIDGTLIPTS